MKIFVATTATTDDADAMRDDASLVDLDMLTSFPQHLALSHVACAELAFRDFLLDFRECCDDATTADDVDYYLHRMHRLAEYNIYEYHCELYHEIVAVMRIRDFDI